jgi:hypothetical protein
MREEGVAILEFVHTPDTRRDLSVPPEIPAVHRSPGFIRIHVCFFQ